MFALVFVALLQVSEPAIADGELARRVEQARGALSSSPAEVVRISNEGLADVSEPTELHVELAYLLGCAHQTREEFDPAVEAFAKAQAYADALSSSAFALHILRRRAFCLRMLGRYEEASQALEGALELVRDDDVGAAETLNELGIVQLKRGDPERAIDCWRSAMASFEAADDMASASVVLGNLGILHGDLGQHEMSVDCIERSMQLAQDAGGGAARSYNLINLGDAYRGLGNLERALELMTEALELFEASGSAYDQAVACVQIGLIHHDLGDGEGALAFLRRADELHERLGLEAEKTANMARIARVLASMERAEEAVELSRESLERSQGVESSDTQIDAHAALAVSLDASGDHEGAREHLDRVRELEAEVDTEDVKRRMERLYVELGVQRRERELAESKAALAEQRSERNALLAILGVVMTVAVSGWGVVLVRRRAHRQLMESFGALQATNAQLVSREAELREAFSRIQRLEGLLPICAGCKSIRTHDEEWLPLESYFSERSDVRFSHGYCPTCLAEVQAAQPRDTSPKDV